MGKRKVLSLMLVTVYTLISSVNAYSATLESRPEIVNSANDDILWINDISELESQRSKKITKENLVEWSDDGTSLTTTDIRSVMLKGSLDCSGSISAVSEGNIKDITNFLTLTNSINAVDMDGTGTGILFNQYYYDGTTPASQESSQIYTVAEQDWTSTASTQDSSLVFATSLDGVLGEGMRIDSDGYVGIGTVTPENVLHIKKVTGTEVAIFENIGSTSGIRLKNSLASTAVTTVGTIFDLYQEEADYGDFFTVTNSGEISVNNTGGMFWHVGSTRTTGRNTGLEREADGLLQVNNGTLNSYRDLKVRSLYLDEALTYDYIDEPSDPSANKAVEWWSTGVGAGDLGDKMAKSNDGTTVSVATIVDKSTL